MNETLSLLTRRQAAEFLGVKENTLAVWACNQRYDLPYVKIGRLIKYRRADLEQFVLRNMCSAGGSDAL